MSQQISDRLGVNPYLYPRVDKHDEPGTVRIFRTKKEKPKYVACLFSQFGPSTPNRYYLNLNRKYNINDTYENRLLWFSECLNLLSQYISFFPDIDSVAFPYKIGCGLAGGNWNQYNLIIEKWGQFMEERGKKVVYYKLE